MVELTPDEIAAQEDAAWDEKERLDREEKEESERIESLLTLHNDPDDWV